MGESGPSASSSVPTTESADVAGGKGGRREGREEGREGGGKGGREGRTRGYGRPAKGIVLPQRIEMVRKGSPGFEASMIWPFPAQMATW